MSGPVKPVSIFFRSRAMKISTVRVSVEYPGLLTVIVCLPGDRFVHANGVIQFE